MANFFEGIWEAAKQPFAEARFLGDVVTGETSLKDAPGKHQEMMNKVTVPILGNNKLAKNSDAVAGAIVGGIMAAPAIAGAAGGAAGGSGGGSFGFGGFGTEGAFSKYFQPLTQDIGNLFSGGASDDFLGQLADAGSAFEEEKIMQGGLGKKIQNLFGNIGGPSDELLGQLADAEGAGDTEAAEAIMEKIKKGGFSMDKLEGIGRALSNIQGAPKQSLSHSSRGGGGFRGSSSKNMAQSLLDREYEALYSEPLYKQLTKDAY